jgi:hypothetical protein
MADVSASEVNAAPNGVENAEMQGSGCGLLVVVGEPFTEAHKELILEEITKGKVLKFSFKFPSEQPVFGTGSFQCKCTVCAGMSSSTIHTVHNALHEMQ